MKLSEEIDRIVEIVTLQYPNDIDGAVAEALARCRELPDYQTQIENLFCYTLRQLIHDARHRSNTEMKRQTGYYGKPSKVNVGGTSVAKVARSSYLYYIAGKTLGDIKGKEIDQISNAEQQRADGHIFNVKLLQWCKTQGVPEEKCIKNIIPEKKLRANFDRIYAETHNVA